MVRSSLLHRASQAAFAFLVLCTALGTALATAPAALGQSAPLRLTPAVTEALMSAQAAAAYTCPSTCVAPGCQCGTTDPVATLAPPQTPQFLVVTVDDCVNANTEALLAPVFRDGSLKNPDGRAIPLTYFLSLVGCATGTNSNAALVKSRYDKGDEMAVHTRAHSTGTGTSAATWASEIASVKTFLSDAGVNVARDVKGFRAPYLATNSSMFTAVKNAGFLYDSSVMESPFYSPVSRGIGSFLWPYTFDYGKAQLCSGWASDNNCPSGKLPGLWELPLYEYVSTTDVNSNPAFYGVLDLGGPQAYSGYPSRIEGNDLRNIFQLHFNERYTGNRAPMMLGFHAPGFDSGLRQREIRENIATMLAQPNVWAVTATGLVEWMQNPVPASQMTAWYQGYCQRHPCSAATPVASEDDVRAQVVTALSVFPNPARGTFSVDATLATAGAATVEVVDLLGRQVRALMASGTDRVRASFTTAGLAPGTYLVRVTDAQGHASAPERLIVR